MTKSKQEAYEQLIEMSKNDDYTTGKLLDYLYRQNYYRLIGIDLSRQTNITILQQVNYAGKLEEDDGAEQKVILNFSLNLLTVSE